MCQNKQRASGRGHSVVAHYYHPSARMAPDTSKCEGEVEVEVVMARGEKTLTVMINEAYLLWPTRFVISFRENVN